MKTVIGIGNYGKRYLGTRHNVGFEVVDLIARRHGTAATKKGYLSLTATVEMGGEQVLLVKPQTYVNETGQAARQVLDWFKLTPADVLVVCDDANLPLGSGRARRGGSSGGHKGLQSVIAHLGTEDFPRLRLGIGGTEKGGMIDHVLSRFAPEEREVIEKVVSRAADAAALWVAEGMDACMNSFNYRDQEPGEDPEV
jgi:peptidyl-tRNA hydrolase, PTH1 family